MAVMWCSGSGIKVRENGELTSCFVDTLLLIPTAVVLFILLPALVVIVRSTSNVFGQSCVRFKHHTARWILTIILMLCFLAKIGEGFMYQKMISTTPLHLYLPNMFSFLCLILVTVFYDIVEVSHFFPVKKLSIIFVYWLSSVIVWTVKFVHLYQVKGPYDMRLWTNLCILVFYTLLLIIERRVISSHLPTRSRSSSWSRATGNGEEEEACREFQEGRIKYLYDFSNFLSRSTFSWMRPMLRLGNSRPLEPEDLGELPPIDKASYNHKRFIEAWEKEKIRAAQKNTTPSLWRSYFIAYRGIILVSATLRLLGDLLSFIGPLCLKQIVAYVERTLKSNGDNDPKPQNEDDVKMSISDFFGNGFVLSVVILLGTIASTTFMQAYFHTALRYSMNLRASLQVLIYNKSLNLSSFSISGGKMDSGQVVNHISTDAQNISMSMTFLHNAWAAPLKMLLALILIVNELGVAALLGFLVLLVLIPANYFLASKMGYYQKTALGISDDRLKNSNEMLQGIKLLKLYAWEGWFCEIIEEIRAREIVVKMKTAVTNGLVTFITTCTTTMVALVMFASYVKISGKELTASKAFATLALINLMKVPLFILPMLVRMMVNARVSTKRLLPYLLTPEISHLRDEAPVCVIEDDEESPGPDEFKMVPLKPTNDEPTPAPGSPTIEVSVKFSKDSANQKVETQPAPSTTDPDFCIPPRIAVIINDASFSWDPEADQPTISNVDVNVPKGKLTMIVGPVGSGKSSLVNALLGEMSAVGGQVLWANDVTVAYAAQKPWLLNNTVKNNVLFGQPFIRERYEAILQACALKSDLEILPAGDETEIGEKGINLSGGQKQRISLARAVYSGANFVMFDDPLSALDAHVGQHVFEQAIMKMLVQRGRTVVLVTHQLQYLPKADNVVVMKDGRAVICSSFKDIEKSKSDNVKNALTLTRQQSVEREQQIHEEDETEVVPERRHTVQEEIKEAGEDEEVDDEKGKLMTKEEREKGAVAMRVYLSYAKSCGYLFVIVALVLSVVAQGGIVGADWWLSIWSSDRPRGNKTADHDVDYYLAGYASFSIAAVVLTFFKSISIALCCLQGAKLLHVRMLRRIIQAPMRFFDTTPIGRVLNRMSSDTAAIDSNLPMMIQNFINTMLASIAALVVQAAVTPYFLLVVMPFIVIYYYIQRFIRRSTRELQRLDSISKSPIYAQLSETLGGLSTIRAYRSQERFQLQIMSAIDKNNTAFIFTQEANRWLGLRLDYGGAMIVFLAAVSSVSAALSGTISPGLVGLALTYALSVAQVFNWVVRMATEIEMSMNAVERVDHYSNIDIEPSPKDGDVPPTDNWPEKGEIALKDLTLAYAHELPPAVKDVSVNIKAGEKIGVCGRTGSGKSTITLGLFRMLEHFEGHIVVDGIDISQMSLRVLRSRLAIIPQDPILFQGTVRFNLDPRGVHEDDALWRALEVAQLKSAISALSGGLEGAIVEGGENLSVGQRQLFCLARALLVKSRVLVMDEATANVDLETDKLIQEVVRSAFKEFTILTIAHRIDTILDSDRIMVLDQGRLIEWDSPDNLLANEESVFSSLVKAHK